MVNAFAPFPSRAARGQARSDRRSAGLVVDEQTAGSRPAVGGAACETSGCSSPRTGRSGGRRCGGRSV